MNAITAAQIQVLTEAREILHGRAERAAERLPALDRLHETASRRISGLEEAARVLDAKIRHLQEGNET